MALKFGPALSKTMECKKMASIGKVPGPVVDVIKDFITPLFELDSDVLVKIDSLKEAGASFILSPFSFTITVLGKDFHTTTPYSTSGVQLGGMGHSFIKTNVKLTINEAYDYANEALIEAYAKKATNSLDDTSVAFQTHIDKISKVLTAQEKVIFTSPGGEWKTITKPATYTLPGSEDNFTINLDKNQTMHWISPGGKPVKLVEATHLGQKVLGTTTSSIYRCIALNERVKLAARWTENEVHFRVETKGETYSELEAIKKHFTWYSNKKYGSIHFPKLGGIPSARVIGAFLMGMGIEFDLQIKKLSEALI